METGDLLKLELTLPDKERADLASCLIDSLAPTVDPGTDLAWQQEAARRLDEIDSGRVKTVPWDEVQRKGRALLNGQ